MKKIGLIFVGVLSVLAITGLASFVYIKDAQKKSIRLEQRQANLERSDCQKAEDLLASKSYKTASHIIKKYQASMESGSEMGERWLNLFLRLNAETANVTQLEALYQFQPHAFLNNEEASFLLAESFLLRGRNEELQRLRQGWLGKENKQSDWLLLDADALILEGERTQAIAKLESQRFEGPTDTPRLIQLALLHLSENPKKAWNTLETANSKDPHNPEVLTFRGKLLESVGKSDLALKEYVAAAAANTKNLTHHDQLIDFHLRHAQFDEALQVMEELLDHPQLTEEITVKAFFWNRVVKPFAVDWKNIFSAETKAPLYTYLIHLTPPAFWNESLFHKIPDHKKYSERSQAVWWLRLLSALQQDEQTAWNMIDHNPFAHISWNPSLELAFRRILNYRQQGTLYFNDESVPTAEELSLPEGEIPDFFDELDLLAGKQQTDPNFKIPEETDQLLRNNEAFVAALMAAGWNEAAIDMHYTKTPADALPAWVNQQFGEILRTNHGLAGVEQRAREAHYTGQTTFAQALYQTIQKDSSEAKSYLARQAFIDQQWTIARELTIQLLKEYPGNQQLWDNLSKIEAMITKDKQ